MIKKKIKMDLSINNTPQVVYAVQGDTNTRNVVIDLYNAGSAWTVPDGASGVVKFQKADGKGGIYDKLPNGFPAVVYEENSNQIEVSLAPQVLTFPGEVKSQVSLIYDNNIISTFSFVVLVQEDPSANAEKSTDYVNWDRYFIPQTSGASVGQYLKIAKVDDLGRVIEVSPVDAPSGSGAIDGELDMKSNSILNVGTVEFWNEDELATVVMQSEFPEGDNESGNFNGVIEVRTSRGDEPVVIRNVADAKNPNEAVSKKQLDESMDHSKLSNRDAADQHPIEAITGLKEKLEDLESGSIGPQGPKGDKGDKGDTGKSAYEFAKDGGYTGSEAEFAAKLAKEFPDSLPNPHKLIFTGAVSGEYDGSGEVTVNIPASGSDTETVLSDNLFDKSAAAYGQCFYYGSSGYQMVSEDLKYYSFVPLRGAGTYRTKFMKTVHSSTGARIALVNDDNQWVTNVTGTLGDTAADSNFVDFEFVVTQAMIAQGVTKVAFDVYSIYIDQVMIVKDRTYPTEFIPYGYIEIATETGKKMDNVLCEKIAVFLGDSICAGTTTLADAAEYGYGWGGLIGEANKMTWKNYGQNGAVITSSITETNRYIPNQADSAIAEHPQADYVIFDGGTNDSAYTELGTLAKAGYAPTDYANFTNAFESLLLKLLTAFPKAKIGYIIPPKMNRANDFSSESNTYRQFFDRAIEICEKWGVPYLDLWKVSPMNPMLSVHYDSTLTADQANEQGKLYTDGQHLTLAGYQRITPQIEAWMRNL